MKRALGLVLLAALCAGPAGAGRQARPQRYLLTTFNAKAPRNSVELRDGSGRRIRLLAALKFGVGSARWSPAGTRLAWASFDGVTVARADGTHAHVVVRRQAGCRAVCVEFTFAWSPDGRKLIVAGAGRATNRVVRVDVATGRQVDVTPRGPKGVFRTMGWRGGLVAYTRLRGVPGTRSCCALNLLVARPDGTGTRSLVSFADPIHDGPSASWSPDGGSIAFVTEARDPADPRLAVVDVGAGELHRLDGLTPIIVAPAWSPASDRIAVAEGNAVVTVLADGSDPQSLVTPGSEVVWSASGDMTIVRGRASNEVLESPDGRAPATLRFRLPKGKSVLTIDAR